MGYGNQRAVAGGRREKSSTRKKSRAPKPRGGKIHIGTMRRRNGEKKTKKERGNEIGAPPMPSGTSLRPPEGSREKEKMIAGGKKNASFCPMERREGEVKGALKEEGDSSGKR